MPSPLENLLRARAETRRADGLRRAAQAIGALEAMGAKAVLAGSMARDDFHARSDVDLVLLDDGGRPWIDLFHAAEDAMRDMRFDLIHLADVRPDQRSRLLETTLDASALRSLVG